MLSWCHLFLSSYKYSIKNKLKTLFNSNSKTSEDHWSERSFVEGSNSERVSSNEKSLSLSPSVDASAPTINYEGIQFTSSSDLDDDHPSYESQTLMLLSPQRSNDEETLSEFESSTKLRSG